MLYTSLCNQLILYYMTMLLNLLMGVSGSGKGTVMRRLKKEHPEYVYPLSVTTRAMRPNEEDGVQYKFVDMATFERYKSEDMLLEWAQVHDKDFYGVLRAPVEEAIMSGKTVVREVDTQGLESILAGPLGGEVFSIFLLPPSEEVMRDRILRRSALAEEEIERRLESARDEVAIAKELCDVLILSIEGEQDAIYAEVEKAIEMGDDL